METARWNLGHIFWESPQQTQSSKHSRHPHNPFLGTSNQYGKAIDWSNNSSRSQHKERKSTSKRQDISKNDQNIFRCLHNGVGRIHCKYLTIRESPWRIERKHTYQAFQERGSIEVLLLEGNQPFYPVNTILREFPPPYPDSAHLSLAQTLHMSCISWLRNATNGGKGCTLSLWISKMSLTQYNASHCGKSSDTTAFQINWYPWSLCCRKTSTAAVGLMKEIQGISALFLGSNRDVSSPPTFCSCYWLCTPRLLRVWNSNMR